VAAAEMEPMSIGDILFERQLATALYDECKHDICVKNLLSSDNRPILEGKLTVAEVKNVNCTILIDSGATSSDINESFAHRNLFGLSLLLDKIRCRSFDGSFSSSGDISHYVDTLVKLPLVSGKEAVSTVKLYVTKIATADVILGSSWLRDSKVSVGGCQNDVVVHNFIQSVDNGKETEIAKLLKEYSNVFVTDSLAALPPHRKGFDCKVNLKQDAVPPFGKMYNLSKEERDQLNLYVEENLKKRFYQSFIFFCRSFDFLR
jgi:hypothetical protein